MRNNYATFPKLPGPSLGTLFLAGFALVAAMYMVLGGLSYFGFGVSSDSVQSLGQWFAYEFRALLLTLGPILAVISRVKERPNNILKGAEALTIGVLSMYGLWWSLAALQGLTLGSYFDVPNTVGFITTQEISHLFKTPLVSTFIFMPAIFAIGISGYIAARVASQKYVGHGVALGVIAAALIMDYGSFLQDIFQKLVVTALALISAIAGAAVRKRQCR